MVRNVNDIISALPASRRCKVEKRAAALIAEEKALQKRRHARTTMQNSPAKF